MFVYLYNSILVTIIFDKIIKFILSCENNCKDFIQLIIIDKNSVILCMVKLIVNTVVEVNYK